MGEECLSRKVRGGCRQSRGRWRKTGLHTHTSQRCPHCNGLGVPLRRGARRRQGELGAPWCLAGQIPDIRGGGWGQSCWSGGGCGTLPPGVLGGSPPPSRHSSWPERLRPGRGVRGGAARSLRPHAAPDMATEKPLRKGAVARLCLLSAALCLGLQLALRPSGRPEAQPPAPPALGAVRGSRRQVTYVRSGRRRCCSRAPAAGGRAKVGAGAAGTAWAAPLCPPLPCLGPTAPCTGLQAASGGPWPHTQGSYTHSPLPAT